MKDKKIISLLLIIIGISLYFMPNYVVEAETYNGEYSIDYLLRNYSIVTLGQKERKMNFDGYSNLKKGDFLFTSFNDANIEGALLINGDFKSGYEHNVVFGNDASNVNSFVKGTIDSNITTNSNLITGEDYIDFKELYINVLNESKKIADNTQYHINSAKMEVSKPGIYTIHNTARIYYTSVNDSYGTNNSILIKNYNKNELYIFNYYNELIDNQALPNINIMEQGSSNAISLKDYISNNEYTGNIIFNFPNALYINISYYGSHYYGMFSNANQTGFIGNVIAPKATVSIGSNFNYDSVYSNIIANSIVSSACLHMVKTNYTGPKKVVNNRVDYVQEPLDYSDDFYIRDYSISDLLQNYSLITLGKKGIDSKSKLLKYGNTPGSVKMFHITGQALISGDLYGDVSETEKDDLYKAYQKFDRTAFDLESNEVTESYVKGQVNKIIRGDSGTNTFTVSVIQPWDNMSNDNKNYVYQKNSLFIGEQQVHSYYSGPGNYTYYVENYVNFDRLYNNVVTEQKAINEGTKLKVGEDGIVHIPIGGCYYIEDISEVKEVVFDNFGENKDKLTIVTVKNEGDINFPLISKDTGSYKGIVTNDYYGKESATHLYERDTFIQDSYYGNIVWNAPNATYIKLKNNAPFVGHLIAPNADVDTPETHFAGCFIVNSIYGEGNTEAHFYPITAKLDCDCAEYRNLSDDMKQKFSEFRLKKLLGGDASTIESSIIGDEVQYRNDVSTLEHVLSKCPSFNGSTNSIVNILKNPPTYGTIGAVLLIVIGLIGFSIYKKKKKAV